MVSMAALDPTLSTSHPFYDVARHGILQVAGRLTIRLVPKSLGACKVVGYHRLPLSSWATKMKNMMRTRGPTSVPRQQQQWHLCP